jgi:membrane-associated phospholipid phosphatase
MADAGVAAWDAKYTYWNPPARERRPRLGRPGWRPFVDAPVFPSYGSGHATYSGAAAKVLGFLFPESAAEFEAKAQEAAMSRLWGGIHRRAHSDTGLDIGRRIGELFVERARADGA